MGVASTGDTMPDIEFARRYLRGFHLQGINLLAVARQLGDDPRSIDELLGNDAACQRVAAWFLKVAAFGLPDNVVFCD